MKNLRLLTLTILAIAAVSVSKASDTKGEEAIAYGQELCVALWSFKLDSRRYPTSEEGLYKLLEPKIGDGGIRGEPYLIQIESDPWGNPYMYRTEGDGFRVWSMGSDGLSGSDDDIGPDICEA